MEIWINDFRQAQGYRCFLELLLTLESRPVTLPYINYILEIVSQFVYVGIEPLSVTNTNSPYYAPGPVLMAPGSTDIANSVRNLEAFQILHNYFLMSCDGNGETQLKVLDCILGIYAANYNNYVLVQQLHTLAHFLEGFHSFPLCVEDGILRLLVFVGTVVHCIPFQELSALSLLLQEVCDCYVYHMMYYMICHVMCDMMCNVMYIILCVI